MHCRLKATSRLPEWVANSLPPSFTFEGIAGHTLGNQTHEIACFHYEDAQFALLPGCVAATLGYDRDHPFRPTPAQAADWENSMQKEFGVSLEEALDISLTKLRKVTIAPFLIDVKSRRFPYDADDNGRQGALERIRVACAQSSVCRLLMNGNTLVPPGHARYSAGVMIAQSLVPTKKSNGIFTSA
jgi:hypothetical protein